MEFAEAGLRGVVRIVPKVFRDDRGFFMETWQRGKFAEAGLALDFVQENHSRSRHGVLRGMHYQRPHAQGKLVRVVSGSVYDVVVDLRRQSPTYGQWEGFYLDADKHEMLWVPVGFAHGFLVMSEYADFVYKVTDFWAPEAEHVLRWNDPDVGIQWPLPKDDIQLNDKDRSGMYLADCEAFA